MDYNNAGETETQTESETQTQTGTMTMTETERGETETGTETGTERTTATEAKAETETQTETEAETETETRTETKTESRTPMQQLPEETRRLSRQPIPASGRSVWEDSSHEDNTCRKTMAAAGRSPARCSCVIFAARCHGKYTRALSSAT